MGRVRFAVPVAARDESWVRVTGVSAPPVVVTEEVLRVPEFVVSAICTPDIRVFDESNASTVKVRDVPPGLVCLAGTISIVVTMGAGVVVALVAAAAIASARFLMVASVTLLRLMPSEKCQMANWTAAASWFRVGSWPDADVTNGK